MQQYNVNPYLGESAFSSLFITNPPAVALPSQSIVNHTNQSVTNFYYKIKADN